VGGSVEEKIVTLTNLCSLSDQGLTPKNQQSLPDETGSSWSAASLPSSPAAAGLQRDRRQGPSSGNFFLILFNNIGDHLGSVYTAEPIFRSFQTKEFANGSMSLHQSEPDVALDERTLKLEQHSDSRQIDGWRSGKVANHKTERLTFSIDTLEYDPKNVINVKINDP
jgi:hypothetical protein